MAASTTKGSRTLRMVMSVLLPGAPWTFTPLLLEALLAGGLPP